MFKIEWDKKNNGVRLIIDGNKETLNVSPRPVFFEELDILGLDKLGWKYPKSVEPLLWACDRRYFYCGDEVMIVKGGNLYDSPTIEIKDKGRNLILKPININILKKVNERLLSWIEYEAINFVIDTFRRHSNKRIDNFKVNDDIDYLQLAERLAKRTKQQHVVIKEDCDSFDIMPLDEAKEQGKRIVYSTKVDKVLASFSGGKDSLVLLDLVARALPPSEFVVIYSDTGYELPSSIETYQKVIDRYYSKSNDYQFYTARNHQSVEYYWERIGSPSNIHRWCCSVMKTAPLYRLLKELHGTGKQPRVLTFDGVRAEESDSRSGYARIGKAVKHNSVINARPLLYWNDTEIYLYLLLHDLDINIAYRKGFSRVGCVICPFGNEKNDYLVSRIDSKRLSFFIDKIKTQAVRSGVKDIENYVKDRKWKVRAGGRDLEIDSKLEIIGSTPDFKAIIHNPRTDFFEWLKVLSPYKTSVDGNTTHCEIVFRNNAYSFQVVRNKEDNWLTIHFPNIGSETILVGLLKRILNKTTQCVHCEACEVECPTGALKIVSSDGKNKITVQESKCTHCYKCLTFSDKGCIVANSLTEPTSIINNMEKNSGSIDRYNTFGLRQLWVSKFFNNRETFFELSDHGLNVKKQIPALAKWLVDAEFIISENKKPTLISKYLSEIFISKTEIVWEIIWINISHNSKISNWYSNSIEWGIINSRQTLIEKLSNSFPNYQEKTRTNGLQSLMNTFKESPLGDILGQCIPVDKNYVRSSNYQPSKTGIAYALYRYAERNNKYSMRVSEMMQFDNEGSIYNLFGVEEEFFKSILRTLHSEKEPVLHADLNMGLDHITLRSELTSTEVIEIMLRQQ